MSETHETAPNLAVNVAGQCYAYRRFGKAGGVPLLFLQHFRGTMDNWDPLVVDAFAADHDVILFDNAGVGGSSGPPSSTVADMARHVVAFVAALKISQLDILGFSLGGFVAQQVTLDRPALVRRLVLAGTGPRGGEGMANYADDVVMHATPDVPSGEDFLYLFFSPSPASQAAGRAFLKRRASRTAEPDGPAGTDVRDAQLGAIAEWGAPTGGDYKSLQAIKQLVFVANGSQDVMVPSVNSLILAQNLPMAFLSLYPDAGHGAIFQYPELFTDQAIRFLSS